MYPTITAIIIDRNRPIETQEAIDSINTQGYEVDIQVWSNNTKNRGVAYPTNVLAKCRPADYYLLMDNDATLGDGFLDACFEVMDQYPNCAIVCGRVKQAKDDTILTPNLINSVKEMYNEGDDQFFDVYGLKDPDVAARVGVYAATGCLVRSDAWIDAGGYDPDYFAYYCECELSARLIERGWELWYQPKAVVYHKLTHKSRSLGLMLYLMIRNHYYFQIEFIPWKYAIPQCMKWGVWAIVKGWRTPKCIFKAYLDVFRHLPKSLKKRKPTTNEYVLMGWKKLLR